MVGIEGTGGDAVYLVVVMRSMITGRWASSEESPMSRSGGASLIFER